MVVWQGRGTCLRPGKHFAGTDFCLKLRRVNGWSPSASSIPNFAIEDGVAAMYVTVCGRTGGVHFVGVAAADKLMPKKEIVVWH